MKLLKTLTYLLSSLLIFTSCQKELSFEGVVDTNPPVIPDPEPQDTAPVFRLTAFYSDIPIDFDETDNEVKLETDLWPYVFDYVKDDYHVFRSDSVVEVHQNAIKHPALGDEILYRSYKIGRDNLGDYIEYLTPDYENAKYRLYEWQPDHFVIGVKSKHGARVYSRFERVTE